MKRFFKSICQLLEVLFFPIFLVKNVLQNLLKKNTNETYCHAKEYPLKKKKNWFPLYLSSN